MTLKSTVASDIRDVLFEPIMSRRYRAHVTTERRGIVAGSIYAAAKLAGIGILPDFLVDEGAPVDPGDLVVSFQGNPTQIALAEERVIGAMAKFSGIATAAWRATALARGRCRIASGRWTKMPAEIGQPVRDAIVLGGAAWVLPSIRFRLMSRTCASLTNESSGLWIHGMIAKVARRISDGKVLAMVKQFLKSTGDQGVPQGSPLSPLLANLALNALDHSLDRGSGFITYARYLDDMVVLAPDSAKGKAWADRALARIRCEAEAIGVSLNTEKTRIVTITDEHAVFAFLGFEFRLVPSTKTGRWYPCMTPRPKKITAVLQKVRDTLRTNRHLSVQAAVAQVNPILRGWVNYFRVGNSSQAFHKVQYHVERKVRRFAAKQRKRTGFGWKRWSSDIVYGSWGLFRDYHLAYASAKARTS